MRGKKARNARADINGTLDHAPGIDTMRRLVSAPVWPTVERIGKEDLSESNATFKCASTLKLLQSPVT